jgi:ATP-dependent helicase/DNAse subunit B
MEQKHKLKLNQIPSKIVDIMANKDQMAKFQEEFKDFKKLFSEMELQVNKFNSMIPQMIERQKVSQIKPLLTQIFIHSIADWIAFDW